MMAGTADTNVIDEYQEHFSQVTAEIVAETNKLSKLTGSEKSQVSKKIQQLVRDANELLEQIDLEIKSLPPNNREKFQNHLKSYQVELVKLENDYKRAYIFLSKDVHMREDLFGSDDALITEDMRAKLLNNSERLERSSQRLEDGYKICLETEQMGACVLEDLNHQRSTMERARDRLHKTNEDIGKSSRILTSMIRRTIQNRLVLILMSLLMIVIICVTLYFIFRPH